MKIYEVEMSYTVVEIHHVTATSRGEAFTLPVNATRYVTSRDGEFHSMKIGTSGPWELDKYEEEFGDQYL